MWRVVIGATIVLVVAAMFLSRLQGHTLTAREAETQSSVACTLTDALYASHQSGLWTSVSGVVVTVLPDTQGQYRHQRFIVRCGNGHTVLIVNDIDIGQRVPVVPGARVVVHGQFIWDSQGGLLHFTHHDPGGGSGGWILYRGKLYA